MSIGAVMRIVEKYDMTSTDRDFLLEALEKEFNKGKEIGNAFMYNDCIDKILYVDNKAYWEGYDDATLDILGY